MAAKRIDRLFFGFIIGLSLFGFLIFLSASLGLLNREGATFNLVAGKQLIILLVGLAGFLVVGKIDYRRWQNYAWLIFVLSLAATYLVFVPGLGFEAGGAKRWINIGTLTVQPAEFLKIGFIVYFGAWLSRQRSRVNSFRHGLCPFIVGLGIVGLPLILQPDMDTLFIVFSASLAMFMVSEAKWSHIGLILLLVLIGFLIIVWSKPYILERVKTFLDPDREPLAASWQVNQSLIAIGSGGLTGRGFGQSLQKFHYLPEPIGDSIFAVAAEEFGFVGGLLIILSFLVFALLGLKIAIRAPTAFGRLLAVGVVIMISTGAFINIASMLALIPLTGTPLSFVSHGGTALIVSFVAAGMLFSVARGINHKKS